MTATGWTAGAVVAGAFWMYALIRLRRLARNRRLRERRELRRAAVRAYCAYCGITTEHDGRFNGD